MTYDVRRLSLEDMDRTAVVLRVSFDDRLPWLTGLHTPEADRNFLRDQVFQKCELWGAVDAEIVGFIAFGNGWVDHLYVLPEYQAKGIGGRLLEIAKKRSPSLHLWTFQKNIAARRFYEKRGFAPVEETDGSSNDEQEPDVLYRWPTADGT